MTPNLYPFSIISGSLPLPAPPLLTHYCVSCPDNRPSLTALGRISMPILLLGSAGVQCVGLFNDVGPRVQTTTHSWLLTFQRRRHGTSLVLQWLGVCLPMQGHGFHPRDRSISETEEQLSRCTATTEPVL